MRAIRAYEYSGEETTSVAEPPMEYGAQSSEQLELITSFQAGSTVAFTALYQQLFPPVYHFACSLVPEYLAADFTADAFTALWKSEKNFPSVHAIKVYLQRIVKNGYIDHYRHEKVKQQHEQQVLYALPLVESGHAALVEKELLQLVYRAVEQLPIQRRKVFTLYFLHRVKDKQIARLLGISLHTVHGHKAAALKQLRLSLAHLVALSMLVRVFFSFS